MQDEINSKTVALSINLGKKGMHLTAAVLKAAMRKFLKSQEQSRSIKKQKKLYRSREPTHGKQTVKELMKQNQGLTQIEITDANIKSFERIANKYNIDFSLMKDKASEKPRYVVFFKARDVDVMTQAFKEYSAKEMTKDKRPSLKKALSKALEAVKAQTIDKALDKDRQRQKNRNRGQEL